MVTFEKRGEEFCAVKDGQVIACVRKNYIGTHGHWRGWEHRLLHDGRMVHASFFGHGSFPWVFGNLNEFKDYYTKGE